MKPEASSKPKNSLYAMKAEPSKAVARRDLVPNEVFCLPYESMLNTVLVKQLKEVVRENGGGKWGKLQVG